MTQANQLFWTTLPKHYWRKCSTDEKRTVESGSEEVSESYEISSSRSFADEDSNLTECYGVLTGK